MLDLVGILLRMRVDALHARSLRGAMHTRLRGVDIVVQTVQQADGDHGRETLEEALDVVQLVDLAGAHGVVVEGAHGPGEGSAAATQFGVEAGFALRHEFLVVDLGFGGFGRGDLFAALGGLGEMLFLG